jgi:hypothetical protein
LQRLFNANMDSAGTPRKAPKTPVVQAPDNRTPALELALLRRGVGRRDAGNERCCRCNRTPLIGETVYADERGLVYCELCRTLEPDPPREARVVHGPEFGHTIKLTDHRAA